MIRPHVFPIWVCQLIAHFVGCDDIFDFLGKVISKKVFCYFYLLGTDLLIRPIEVWFNEITASVIKVTVGMCYQCNRIKK